MLMIFAVLDNVLEDLKFGEIIHYAPISRAIIYDEILNYPQSIRNIAQPHIIFIHRNKRILSFVDGRHH